MVDDVKILAVRGSYVCYGVAAARGIRRIGNLYQRPGLTINLVNVNLPRVLLGGGDVEEINRIAGSARSNTKSKTKGHNRGQCDAADLLNFMRFLRPGPT